MPKKLFTSDYQPADKGRKAMPDEKKKQILSVYVTPETKAYLKAHKVKGGKILDEYVNMKNMKTKKELCEWMRDNAACGNSCYVVINGGGISLCSPDDAENLIAAIMGDDYADNLIMLNKGEEYGDFKSIMGKEEYDGTDCFVKVEHLNGYNQENADIQIQYWDE